MFLFDLDIDSDGPTITDSFLLFLIKNFLPSSEITSSGLNQLLFLSLYVSWQTIPCVKSPSKGSLTLTFLLSRAMALVKNLE